MKATIELRFLISEGADAALESHARAYAKDKNAIARDLVNDFARRFHSAHRLYAQRIAADGLQEELPGLELEDDGAARSARR